MIQRTGMVVYPSAAAALQKSEPRRRRPDLVEPVQRIFHPFSPRIKFTAASAVRNAICVLQLGIFRLEAAVHLFRKRLRTQRRAQDKLRKLCIPGKIGIQMINRIPKPF